MIACRPPKDSWRLLAYLAVAVLIGVTGIAVFALLVGG